MIAACRLRGGRLLTVVGVVSFDARENCFFKMLAYDLLVAVYVGLSSRRGSWEAGGSIPGGIDFLIIDSKLSSIQVRASGRLFFVITIKHLLGATDSMRKNQGLQIKWSCKEIGSVSDTLDGLMTANQALYSMLTGIVATVVKNNCCP